MPTLPIPQASLQAPGAPPGPRIDPRSLDTFGASLQDVSRLLLDEADAQKRQRLATQMAQARSMASVETARFLNELSNDPDFDSYEAKSQQFYDQLSGRLRDTMDSDAFWAFGPDLAAIQGQILSRTIGLQESRSDDHAAGQLRLSLHELTTLASTAPSAEEFTLYQDQMRLSIGQAVMAGTIGEEAGVQMMQGTLADTEQLRVAQMIRGNPMQVGALLDDPANFPNLTPEQRFNLQVRAENEVERQMAAGRAAAARAEAAAQEEADAASRDLRLRMALGEDVTEEEVRALAPVLSGSEFNGLLSAWNRSQEDFDPTAAQTYIGLTNMAASGAPEDVFMAQLDDALIDGLITDDQYASFYREWSSPSDGPPTPYELNADALKRGLDAGMFAGIVQRVEVEALRADVLAEYYRRATPDMPAAELVAIRDNLIAEFQSAIASGAGFGETQPVQNASQAAAEGSGATGGPPLPPGAAWTPDTVTDAQINQWTSSRFEYWVERLGSDDAALAASQEAGSEFWRELQQASAWARMAEQPAEAREPQAIGPDGQPLQPGLTDLTEPEPASTADIPPSGSAAPAGVPSDAMTPEEQRAAALALQETEARIGEVLVQIPTEWLPKFARYMQEPSFASLPAAQRLAIIQRFNEMTDAEREEFLTDG